MLNNYSTLSEQLYQQLRYDILVNIEENGDPKEVSYSDSKGIPTIGIGFNLRDQNVRDQVLQVFGLDTAAAEGTAERGYINEIEAIVVQDWTNNEAGLRTALNDVMARREADENVVVPEGESKRETFAFANDAEIQEVFGQIIVTYETTVNDWLEHHGLEAITNSQERAVLVSLAYNSRVEERTDHPNFGFPTLLGLGLRNAIRDGNRAEAWYEIRYNSNAEQSGGIAKRRYYESEVFGLYDPFVGPLTPEQEQARALEVYKMYTAHRGAILAYEQDFGGGQSGMTGGNLNNKIDAANSDYGLAGEDNEVQTLESSFSVAYDYLVQNYVTDLGSGITIDYRDIQIGSDGIDILNGTQRNEFQLNQGDEQSDLILGEGGNDTLSGGGASDILYGGEDDDTLYGGNYANTEDNATDYLFGGEGFDVYHVGNGDIIDDTDGKGRLFYNDNVLLPGFHRDGDDENTYRSLDGAFTYTLMEDQLFVRPAQNGPAVAIINNFSNGNLGIALRDMPDTRIRTSIEVYEYWSIEEYRIQNPGARMAA